MELKKLRVLSDTLRDRLDIFPADVTSAEVYFFHDEIWHSADSGVIAGSAQAAALEATRETDLGYFRPRRGKSVYFWFSENRSAIRVDFSASVQRKAQARAQQILIRLCRDAANLYQATHDPLTGLRNRAVFDQLLAERVRLSESGRVAAALPVSQGDGNLSTQSASVYLLALDIDNFKSINDRFGHGYGDLVLAALGWRLEVAAAQCVAQAGGKFSVDVFRLGGEEFEIIVAGEVSEGEALDIAEQVRRAVGSAALPSKQEHAKLRVRDFFDGSELPSETQRSVTVSVGVAAASKQSSEKFGGAGSSAAALKRQADIALYSAKLGGRDRVRNFTEILTRYGRLSGVDDISGIMSIDIGKEVGVKQGQEFFVFPPNYDGATDYYLGEGRSRKKVGTYPRIYSGRIIAFDVQNEVSFCRLVSMDARASSLPLGSSLEAIPLGSIGHLVVQQNSDAKIADRRTLMASFQDLVGNGPGVAISVNLRRIEEVSDQRGVSQTNDILGRIGQQLIESVGKSSAFGQLGLGTLVAVKSCPTIDEARELATKIGDAIETLALGVEIGVGWVFKPADAPPEGMEESAASDDIVDCAILASSFVAHDEQPVQEFGAYTLWFSLLRSRQADRFDQMVADFARFESVTVPVAWTYNQMALMFKARGMNEEAVDYFSKAHSIATPDQSMVAVNLGSMLIRVGRFAEGFAMLDSIPDKIPASYNDAYFFGALRSDPAEFANFASRHRDRVSDARTRRSWISKEEVLELRRALEEFA